MRLYFAYGSNMDAVAMARRCPGARLIGPARLAGHRFAIARSGHGTIARAPRAGVQGALWRLAPGNLAALDRYEELARGLYRRRICVVRRDGRSLKALVYVAASTVRGRPRAAYIAAILAAARRLAFPADYIATIARTSWGVRPAARSEANVTDRSRLA